jgi:hypothetical protein
VSPEFPVEPGHTVRWWTKTGFVTGRYVRHNRNGRPVVVAAGKKKEKAVDDIYPVNDGHMVSKRGRITVSGYNESEPRPKGRRR